MAKPRGKKARRSLRLNVYRSPQGSWPAIGPGELLLEYFSDEQLYAWRSRGKDLQDYHYLWFFELESQRAANQQKLYLAEDPETGIREMNGLVREDQRAGLSANELAMCTKTGIAWATVQGRVHNVFDVRRAANLRQFADVLNTFKLSRNVRDVEAKLNAAPIRLVKSAKQLRRSFMASNWRELPTMFSTPANSQLFGHLLSQAGFEGVLYSSTLTQRLNLAIFPRQLKSSPSHVRVVQPPAGAQCTELSAETYMDVERVKVA